MADQEEQKQEEVKEEPKPEGGDDAQIEPVQSQIQGEEAAKPEGEENQEGGEGNGGQEGGEGEGEEGKEGNEGENPQDGEGGEEEVVEEEEDIDPDLAEDLKRVGKKFTKASVEDIQKEIQDITKKIEHEKINLRIVTERYDKKYRTYCELQGKPVAQSKEEKEKEKNKEMQKKSHLSLHKSKEKLTISMEKTDDMHYNIEDKKIYSNQSKTGAGYTNTEANDKYKKATNLVNERTVDIFVIDGEEDAVVSTKNKKKINRKRNKLIEVIIEKYDSSTPVRVEKFTGFILARRSKGKKIYEYQLEDNIDKANSILKNNDVKLKGEIIQLIPLEQLLKQKNDIEYYKGVISELQNELKSKQYSLDVDKNRGKETDRDKQISTLKSKNDEFKNLVKKQEQQIIILEKEMKQLQLAYDQLKESYQDLEKENHALIDLSQNSKASKIKKKVAQMQLDENNDQKNIKQMKLRIKKYKNELKKPPSDTRHPATKVEEQKPVETKHDEEDDDDLDDDYIVGDGSDPKAKKMKNAVARFKKKYKDVIKEEKKAKKEKERLERERLENEEKELEDDEDLSHNEQQKPETERTERERREKERIEREEKEREERERIEREEREREEREREEREERERIEREERERQEREERERIEREEREREERERREREERERKERERKERERKEREKKEKEEKEKREREKREKEKKEKEKKDKGVRFGPGANKMMGGNFAKMLADKLKMAPPGGPKKGGAGIKQQTSKPVMEHNVDMVKLLEEVPLEDRVRKRKPSRKVFVEKIDDDDEDSD